MSALLLKRLALSASVAVLLSGAAAANAQNADTAGMPAMPAPSVQPAQKQAPLTIVENESAPVTQTVYAAPAAQQDAAAITGKSAGGLPGKVTLSETVAFGVATNPEY